MLFVLRAYLQTPGAIERYGQYAHYVVALIIICIAVATEFLAYGFNNRKRWAWYISLVFYIVTINPVSVLCLITLLPDKTRREFCIGEKYKNAIPEPSRHSWLYFFTALLIFILLAGFATSLLMFLPLAG